ncbi:hypothetical protein MEO41_27940, partial [Dolichospermum sp. ST_sed4]|nr:hypothetical protein [Dolichospermum sp. ST_sed4]
AFWDYLETVIKANDEWEKSFKLINKELTRRYVQSFEVEGFEAKIIRIDIMFIKTYYPISYWNLKPIIDTAGTLTPNGEFTDFNTMMELGSDTFSQEWAAEILGEELKLYKSKLKLLIETADHNTMIKRLVPFIIGLNHWFKIIPECDKGMSGS